MASYTVAVQEGREQLSQLMRQDYSLQVAKGVIAWGREPQFNIVYMSKGLAPIMSVNWTTTYGLNWTTEIPPLGAAVRIGGPWQQCDFGSSYDLDQTGSWRVNNNIPSGDRNSLNIGRNAYSHQVHVMIGVKDTHGEWRPIFLDPDQLLINMHGSYQPVERVKLWWERGNKTSTMISGQASGATEAGLEHPKTYFSFDEAYTWKGPQDTPFSFF